jgi:hypothetical protein
MQPVGDLYIECGLLFLKILVVQFLNGLLVGASQKNHFWRLEKNRFLGKDSENPQHQHCLPSQDAHM